MRDHDYERAEEEDCLHFIQCDENVRGNPNFEGRQDKLVPGSRHPENSEPKHER